MRIIYMTNNYKTNNIQKKLSFLTKKVNLHKHIIKDFIDKSNKKLKKMKIISLNYKNKIFKKPIIKTKIQKTYIILLLYSS